MNTDPNPNIAACLACPRRQRDCNGPCACTVSGRDTREHYESNDCPLGRFPAAEKALGLGDTVARVLHVTGVGPVAKKVIESATGKPCGCAGRRAALNRLAPYRD